MHTSRHDLHSTVHKQLTDSVGRVDGSNCMHTMLESLAILSETLMRKGP